MAELLIADIKLLYTLVDMEFVEKVLMPLLNFEAKIEFTIDLWD